MTCAVCRAEVVRYVEKKVNGSTWRLGYCVNNHVQTCERMDKGLMWPWSV